MLRQRGPSSFFLYDALLREGEVSDLSIYSEKNLKPGSPEYIKFWLEKPLRKERAARLRAAGEQAVARFLHQRVGGTADVLIEEQGRGRDHAAARGVQPQGGCPPGTAGAQQQRRHEKDRLKVLTGIFFNPFFTYPGGMSDDETHHAKTQRRV